MFRHPPPLLERGVKLVSGLSSLRSFCGARSLCSPAYSVCLSLASEPFSRVLIQLIHPIKKIPSAREGCIIVSGLSSLRSFCGARSLCSPAYSVCLSLASEPFSRVLIQLIHPIKKIPSAREGCIIVSGLSSLRSFCGARSLCSPAYSVCLSLASEPFFSGSHPTYSSNKKIPSTREGIFLLVMHFANPSNLSNC